MRRIAIIIAGLACLTGELSAQHRWTMTIERGFSTYSMAAHDTSTPQIRVGPWHPATYTVRVSHDGAGIGYGVALAVANGKVGATVDGSVFVPSPGLLLLELAPELRRRLTISPSGATLIGHLGPVLDVWAPQGDDVRTAYGAMGGMTLDLPISGRWSAAIRADLTVTGSEATKAEESDAIKRAKTMRRGRLALGITRTL